MSPIEQFLPWLIALAVGLSAGGLITGLGVWLLSAPSVAMGIQRPLMWRVLSPFVRPIEHSLERFLPHSVRTGVQAALKRSDMLRALSPCAFVAGVITCALLCGVIGLALAHFANLSAWQVGAFALIVGLSLPIVWLRDHAIRREHMVLRQLPFVLDLITLSVESGLNLTGALVETAAKGPSGVLRDELNFVLRDIRAGVTRANALQAMSDRMRLPAVSNLIGGLIAADRQGGAIGPLLRGQAVQRRNERFARAEKLAMQAPVKMLFPLIAFIFPCTFIILFFPIFYRLVQDGWLQ